MRLNVTKDKEFGIIKVSGENDTHFPLCLFLSDIKYKTDFKEIFQEVEKASKSNYYFTISYDSSMIEIFSLGAIVSDQEGEYHWILSLNEIKTLIKNWKEILKNNSYPKKITISARLLTTSEYSDLIQRVTRIM